MQRPKSDYIDYVQLANPMTFEDIFILWVGKDKYNEIIAYDPYLYTTLWGLLTLTAMST